jgi:hypothetical protein
MLLGSFWTAVKGFFIQMWDEFSKYCGSIWAITILFFSLAWQGLDLIGHLTIRAFQILGAVVSTGLYGNAGDPCNPGQLGQIMAIANTFFPMDECLKMLFALVAGVWLPLGIYRFIKSWIPAVSGG